MIKYKMRIPIYNCSVIIVIDKEFEKAVLYYNPRENYEDALGSDAYTVTLANIRTGIKQYVYIQRPGITCGAIAHEAKHIVNKIFEDRGIKLDTDNDESECYLLAYIVDKIIYYIDKSNKKK